jgi:hypothetical protein
MSFLDYLEEDNLSLLDEDEFLSKSIEMESNTSSISNNMKGNNHYEWLLISNFIDILRQFNTIITTLSCSKFVTLSLIHPLIVFLETNLSMQYDDDSNNEMSLPLLEENEQEMFSFLKKNHFCF